MISLLKGQNNQVFVSFEPKADNYNGGTLVTLSVSDGEYEDMVSFHIDVLPVNDVPTIRIIEPVENGRVEPGFFSVVGESFDIEEVEFVEVNYGGEWYLANGLNNWGITLRGNMSRKPDSSMGCRRKRSSAPPGMDAANCLNITYSSCLTIDLDTRSQ